MQQNILLAALLASTAVAVPWGPGGRWGTVAPAQASGSANPWGQGGQGGEVVVTDVAEATVVDTVIAQPTATDMVFGGGNGGNDGGDDDTDSSDSVPTPTAIPTSKASHNQVAKPSTTAAVSSAPAAKGQSKPSSPASSPASNPEKTTAAAQPSSTGSASGGSTSSAGSDYQSQVVNSHNVHRANHSSPAISWDAGLASTAQKIAASCNFAHNTQMDGGGYGQNIQAGTAASDVWEAITNSFYNGEVNAYNGQYGMANPGGNFEDYGHFTQVVWADTTSVGCATVHCPNGVSNGAGTKDFTVCNYKPAGNFGGEYAKNVGKSLNKPTVSTNQAASGSY